MKIAIFLDSRSTGGIETHVAQLSRGLLAFNIPFDLIFYNRYDDQHPLLRQLKGSVNVINMKGSIFNLSQYLRKERPLLHTHGYKAGIIGRLLCSLHRLPVVSTHHNGDPGKGRVFIYNLIDRLTSCVSQNICVSERIMNKVPGAKTLIPNFVDFPKGEENHNGRYQVAFVGRFSSEKGPDIFAKIADGLPYSFAMYGDGEMRLPLKESNPKIRMYGSVDMKNHWQKIRLLVIPSRYEGLPLVAIEALSHGIPVVSSRAGDLPKLIKAVGIGNTVNLENIDVFKKRINFWMQKNSEKYLTDATKARTFIYNNYSLRACIPSVIEVYRNAANCYAEEIC
ncbi:MAG: glycosyltransferase family 4 protein [Saccharospirillaceae bacterium]|nr:glycosyltransferase family 4 protein [Saccharospirillaceae bacterium]